MPPPWCICMKSDVRPRAVHGDAVDAEADLGRRVGRYSRLAGPRLIGFQVWPPSSVRKAPAAEMATKMRSVVAGIEEDGVQAHAAGAGLPFGAGAVAAQAGQLVPGLAAVGGAEQGGVFHAGVDRVRIGQRRLEVPDALELPGVLRAVVPLVRRERLAGFRTTCRRRTCCSRPWACPGVWWSARPAACRAGARSCRRRRSAG